MSTDTITLDRTDYVQRSDDEGRDYVAARTLETAARLWVDADPTHRNFEAAYGADVDNDLIYAFTWPTEHGVSPCLSLVHPDADMEGLYPVDALPFGIAASPFAVGDVVTFNGGGQRRKVITVQPDGIIRTEPMDTPGMILAQQASEFTLVRTAGTPAPAARPEPIDAHTALQHVVTFPEGTNIVTIDRLITACVEAGAIVTPVEVR